MKPERIDELIAVYRDGLLGDNVPFWVRHGVDRECGGFLTCLDRDGTVIDTDKAIWLQGRFAWLLSTLSSTVERRSEWLELARHGLDFLRRMKPEFEAVLETVGPGGEFIDHFEGRVLNPGHAIEAAWFILHEASRRANDEHDALHHIGPDDGLHSAEQRVDDHDHDHARQTDAADVGAEDRQPDRPPRHAHAARPDRHSSIEHSSFNIQHCLCRRHRERAARGPAVFTCHGRVGALEGICSRFCRARPYETFPAAKMEVDK